MSRLTASPFHKPSPFEFPRGPPSPPETNTDTILGSGHMLPPTNYLAAQGSGSLDAGIHNMPDTPLRGKKSSSIPYHNTTFRETKERAIQRTSSKSLIIVIPPPTLIQEHGQHAGHTLSNGPFHRLSQGVVMPLLPSMFGQLTAIAREFNFPSTLGLCLYLHYVEDGLILTPRISDDSWQSLWGHLSDPPLPNERRPLIGGKVEFDIDLRSARWYGSWVSAIHREISEHPSHTYPSTAPSHFRGESSVIGGRPSDDEMGETTIQQLSAPIGRHVPKKLSLVERFDVASVRSDGRHNTRSVAAAATEVIAAPQVLSTILQADEPKTGRQQLDNLVKSWRASALISPSPLAAKGQTSLDAPNLPNNMPIDTPEEMPTSPASEAAMLRLEDFTWSVSSAGPQSSGELSPVSWVHAPSVHLAHRVQGSVCTSPSTCTSFGFCEDDSYSYSSTECRVPSVHLAERLQGSVCSSPLTCTSFGPDDDDIMSYTSFFSRIATPDVAQRFYEDCPPTPMTATSWGAPLSYPPSPRCDSPTLSVDLGDRSRFHDHFETTVRYPRSGTFEYSSAAGTMEGRGPWLHVWPYNTGLVDGVASTSSAGPWLHVWPYNRQLEDDPTSTSSTGPWEHVWPYHRGTMNTSSTQSAGPWSHVWPFHKESASSTPASLSASSMGPWSHVWPYNGEIRNRTLGEVSEDKSLLTSPKLLPSGPWPHVWPYNCGVPFTSSPEERGLERFGYPYISIYRPVYPHIEIYPSVPGDMKVPGKADTTYGIVVRLPKLYPTIQLYEPVYPFNLDSIYPVIMVSQMPSAPVETQEGYPFFNLYPPASPPYFSHLSLHLCNPRSQYPYFEIYPELSNRSSRISAAPVSQLSLRTTLQGIYPTFNLYPAVYPYFDIYPCLHTPQHLKSSDKMTTSSLSLSPTLLTAYPSFNLYPNIYPYFNIYPAPYGTVATLSSEAVQERSLSPTPRPVYPSFNLYPGFYPYLNIYPAPYGNVGSLVVEKEHGRESSLSSVLPPMYPSFNLYPRLYPYFDIYPAMYATPVDHIKNSNVGLQVKVTLASEYPYFNLYPGVYPYLEIYPVPYFRDPSCPESSFTSSNNQQIHNLPYPFFNLYPAIYPHFDLYLPRPDAALQQPKKTSKPSSRLTHLELHAMVMMEKAQAGSQGSFSHLDSFLDLPPVNSKMPLINEDEEISQYLQEKSVSNAARNIRISTVPIPSRDRRTPSAYKSGSAVFLESPVEGNQEPPKSYRASLNIQDRSITRSSSLRERLVNQEESSLYRKSLTIPDRLNIIRSSSVQEPVGKLPSPPKPQVTMARRRDSLVLQRVKALDSNNATESSTGISKETLLRFPMPPRSFPPLPPLPQDRGLTR